MSDDEYGNLVNSTIAERKQKDEAEFKAAIEARTRKQELLDRDAKLVSESEKQYAKIRQEQLREILFYGLDPETSKNLEELLNISNQLANIGSQYDPQNKRKIELEAKLDVLKAKITNAGRNLGDITFVKKTYYQSVGKDYLIFPDNAGAYHLFAGELGSFRTTDRGLQVDEKGQPLKIFKQDRITTTPEIPIMDYETVVVKDPKDLPKPIVTTKPRKPLFPPNKNNVADQDNLAKDPSKKRWKSMK